MIAHTLLALALFATPLPPVELAAGALPPLRIDRSVGAGSELALEAGQNRLLIISEEIGRVAVADPSVADLKVVTTNQLLLTAKSSGTTDLTLWNRSNEPLVIALVVTRNLEPLRKQVKDLFPGEKVTITGAGELVILSGEVSDVRIPERLVEVAKLHAKQVANLVKVSGNQQVQLEVRFAEVSRSGLRQIGVNLFHQSSNGEVVTGMTGRGIIPTDLGVPGTGTAGAPPPIFRPQFNNGFSMFVSSLSGDFPFSAMLSLLEQNGLSKTLAEPTLVTLSGQQARFVAGGELPIPLGGSFGQTQVEWKKFGILLDFTPTVIAGDTIHLDLKAEVSDIDQSLAITIGGTTIPGLTSRQSETTIRLGDGQSFAIAGLLSDRVRSQIERVPLLGSIPILGALFRSTQYKREESELLVVVTARLARPVAPHQLPPLPTERELNHPGDIELFLLGWDDGGKQVPRSAPSTRQAGGPSGARGFVR
ncbi:type II and III secretion system protein [Anaeromyxobacter dehalogenans 2CP-1]|uniref:Type II and III secretion system protein n=1 Tax=Anaeromyxobacter dehalogenans (strain ATCC BAA-258 / DSM 21875 / 2CP-1) TaxID=455488 RepID=B8JFG5_ANAD2|nr:type II and III secretion system protein family protein [Anaeromyxobacter dehalogenans]ACL66342.1 type II and III secretion system protein [Anaeromyxobacter dehalogenans 2CP-1]